MPDGSYCDDYEGFRTLALGINGDSKVSAMISYRPFAGADGAA
tara:strand:- start:395 stop:523 length:129 start_codon:yes stop_codon:yes gene_type:complete